MQVSSTTRNLTLNPGFCGFHKHNSNSSNRETMAVAVVPVRRRAAALCMRAVADCRAELVEMEEWRELLKCGDKCGGSSAGVVELLECLEREAIMGEDEGREPLDYNRRALIFDKSATVFQALPLRAQRHQRPIYCSRQDNKLPDIRNRKQPSVLDDKYK